MGNKKTAESKVRFNKAEIELKGMTYSRARDTICKEREIQEYIIRKNKETEKDIMEPVFSVDIFKQYTIAQDI